MGDHVDLGEPKMTEEEIYAKLGRSFAAAYYTRRRVRGWAAWIAVAFVALQWPFSVARFMFRYRLMHRVDPYATQMRAMRYADQNLVPKIIAIVRWLERGKRAE